MKKEVIELAKQHGDRVQFINVKYLKELKEELKEFTESEELNDFQRWIINDLYSLDIPKLSFEPKSILILALRHPMYANVIIEHEERQYKTRTLVHSDSEGGRKYIQDALESGGYHLEEQQGLPLKRLAVQSGLAEYGRNNITYIKGLGSNFSYLGFITDVPSEEDIWLPMRTAKRCESCKACLNVCPTNAIRKDRFLIDNSICLSCINENPGEFPDWLSEEVHHTLYDCLRCQEYCPMNRETELEQREKEVETIIIPEKFTRMLLEGKKKDEFPMEFVKLGDHIGLFDWPDGIPRNIKAIMREENVCI
jgi:epoxyqueuosine reductase